jgi:hypothetical protein
MEFPKPDYWLKGDVIHDEYDGKRNEEKKCDKNERKRER